MGNNYTLTPEFLQSFAILEESYFSLRSTLIGAILDGEKPVLPDGMCLLLCAVASPVLLLHPLQMAIA